MRTSPFCSLILTTLASAACHTIRPIELGQLSAEHPRQVWVTRADQTIVVLAGPQIVNDRLTGFVDDEYRVFSRADVQRIVMRRLAGARTAALVATGTLGAVSLMFLIAGAGDYLTPCTQQSTDDCDPSVVP